MYKFENLVLPEHPEISYQLADGLNNINIKRGDDDTFINHPKGCFIGTPIPDDIPDWVIYPSHYPRFERFMVGNKCPFSVGNDREEIEDDISFVLQKELKRTVEGQDNKFQFHVASSDEIVAGITKDDCIEVYRKIDGGWISPCFEAASEKRLLVSAIRYAARRHYGNPPLVTLKEHRRVPFGSFTQTGITGRVRYQEIVIHVYDSWIRGILC